MHLSSLVKEREDVEEPRISKEGRVKMRTNRSRRLKLGTRGGNIYRATGTKGPKQHEGEGRRKKGSSMKEKQ